MPPKLPAFRLGDIRGIYPNEINEDFVEDFAHAFVGHFNLSGPVVTGRDMRDSGTSLHETLNQALADAGIEVLDIGLCPTELGYFASGEDNIQAAVIVTASHNPARYNGLKCVLRYGRGITYEDGLSSVEALMLKQYRHTGTQGSVRKVDFHSRYLERLREHFPAGLLSKGQIALNGLNGTAATMAGTIADALALPVQWFRKAPGPIPEEGADPANPILAAEMQSFMSGGQFSLGIAWDGDCDRCVFYTGAGELIPTYYAVGIFSEWFLAKSRGGVIVYDTKLCWNTQDVIRRHGGIGIPAKTGHAFLKQAMGRHQAIYGGELSSHHYFGDFQGCDSGMFAWLTMLSLIAEGSEPIEAMVDQHRQTVRCSREISLALTDVEAAFDKLLAALSQQAEDIDHFDGLAFVMPGGWRCSLRRSKTEPVVRLNFESRSGADLLLNEGPKVLDLLKPWQTGDSPWPGELTIQ